MTFPESQCRYLHVALLAGLAAVVYLWLAQAPFLTLDDAPIMEMLHNSDFRGKALFASGGDYYRPLTFVVMVSEMMVFRENPMLFHIAGVVLHFVNALLVYRLAEELVPASERRGFAAFFAAAIFLLHPVVVEPVAWVASQTDLLCTLFALLSLNLVVAASPDHRYRAALLVAAAYFLSLLAKESSITFVVALPLIAGLNGWRRKEIAALVCVLVAGVAMYFFMRQGISVRADSGVTKIVSASRDYTSLFVTLLADMGFYLGKLVYPFPLNFAITEINRALSLAALAICSAVALAAFVRYRESRIPLLIIYGALVPPLCAKIGKLPWTPYAERYLYISVIGVALSAGFALSRLGPRLRALSLVGLLVLGYPSMQRAALWTDQSQLWQDIVTKSPGFPRGYVGLGLEKMKAGFLPEAEKDLLTALKMGLHQEYVYKNLAALYFRQHRYREYEETAMRGAEVSACPAESYRILATQVMMTGKGSRISMEKGVDCYLKAYLTDPDHQGEMLYHAAKLEGALGNRDKALALYRQFLEHPQSVSSMFRPFARKLAAHMAQELEGT